MDIKWFDQVSSAFYIQGKLKDYAWFNGGLSDNI